MLVVTAMIFRVCYGQDVSDLIFFFCFQAEDGIRDLYVTGVQTCALPISSWVLVPARGRSPPRFARSRKRRKATCPLSAIPCPTPLAISCLPHGDQSWSPSCRRWSRVSI